MYEIVSREYYKGVTSLIHGSMHAGKFIAGSLGQILLSFEILSLEHINIISFAASVCVVGFAVFLPGIKWSLYWHPQPEDKKINHSVDDKFSTSLSKTDPESGCCHQNNNNIYYLEQTEKPNLDSTKKVALCSQCKDSVKVQFSKAFAELKKDITAAYTNDHIARWSIWWAMSRAIYWQIGLFTESLWKQIEEETHQHPLNGAVDAAHALISKLSIFTT